MTDQDLLKDLAKTLDPTVLRSIANYAKVCQDVLGDTLDRRELDIANYAIGEALCTYGNLAKACNAVLAMRGD